MTEHWYDEAVIYRLDVETFADSDGGGIGDFRGLVGRLDYLCRLGITCLWLNPVHPTPNRAGPGSRPAAVPRPDDKRKESSVDRYRVRPLAATCAAARGPEVHGPTWLNKHGTPRAIRSFGGAPSGWNSYQ